MSYKKKLIEVALPLEAVNKESAREKSIRHGHPSTLHLWWARRPLAACRAVLFASIVDDPSAHPEKFPTEQDQEKERMRLFKIIEELVKWENINNERVLKAAREEILKSTNGNPPPVLDPFCGGGSIPLEAQRLGLEAHGSDLNPVAVLITKALIEIPPKFADRPPVHPQNNKQLIEKEWKGAQGLAEDVRYYGQWMRDEAEKRIGHLYPKVKITEEILKERPDIKQQGIRVGDELTVIAWLWARTVKCPNPACGARAPLLRSFYLSKKKGREVFLEPIIDYKDKKINFEIAFDGKPTPHTTDRTGARCLFCNEFIKKDQLRKTSMENGLQEIPLAVVVEGKVGRIYLPAKDCNWPDIKKVKYDFLNKQITNDHRWFSPPLYGLMEFSDLFTPRQLLALTTFSDLVIEAKEKLIEDARNSGVPDDGCGIDNGGTGANAYADSVVTYLSFAIDRLANRNSSICSWDVTRDNIRGTFARQAIPITWDYAEANVFSNKTGNFFGDIDWVAKVVELFSYTVLGAVTQLDAAASIKKISYPLISTDPPYYDNVGYSDLSDFFYLWLRRSLKEVYINLFSTLMVPKDQELVANPFRLNRGKADARIFFEDGLKKSFDLMRKEQNLAFPLTVYYAFKQTESVESERDGYLEFVTSTGWETMLESLIKSGFTITGTWPMRTELSNRPVAMGTNALASSIVIACRPRAEGAPLATRREFISILKKELPLALKELQHGNIAPVDLAQAAIGPGMSVFSRYTKVIEADGSHMSVRTALQIINQTLDEFLSEQEGDMDQDTRFCVSWFEQYGHKDGPFGQADVLARAKNTSVQGLVEAEVAEAKAGKLRLLKRDEYTNHWDPVTDRRLTVWECTQHLIRRLNKFGEQSAAELAARLGSGRSEEARALAYRLYAICDRRGWAKEALDYNSLVIAWPEIIKLAHETYTTEEQKKLFT
jgi:putative DNA methylase